MHCLVRQKVLFIPPKIDQAICNDIVICAVMHSLYRSGPLNCDVEALARDVVRHMYEYDVK